MFPSSHPGVFVLAQITGQDKSMDAGDDIPFQFLREITDNFSEERKLGQGAFGVVYKVILGHTLSLWTNIFSAGMASTIRVL